MSTNGNLLVVGVVVARRGMDIGGRFGRVAERVLPFDPAAADGDEAFEDTLERAAGTAGLEMHPLDEPDGCSVVGIALSQIEWGIGQAASRVPVDEMAAMATRVSAALSACGIAHSPADIRVRAVAVEG